MAVARAEHRRFGRPSDGGGRRPRICARTLDAGHAGVAQGYAAAGGRGGVALRPGILFRMSEEFPRAAQSGAISRVDHRCGKRFPRARAAGCASLVGRAAAASDQKFTVTLPNTWRGSCWAEVWRWVA